MSAQRSATKPRYTAGVIQRLATANNVAVVVTSNDVFAHHVTRLSGDDVTFDAIENTIVARFNAPGFWIGSKPCAFRRAICAKAVRDV